MCVARPLIEPAVKKNSAVIFDTSTTTSWEFSNVFFMKEFQI